MFIFKAVITPQIKEVNKMTEYTLFFNILRNTESRMSKIKDKLYSEKTIHSVASINPEDRLYEIKTTPAKMKTIFESLKSFIEIGEYMASLSADKDFSIYFGPKNNEVVVELL